MAAGRRLVTGIRKRYSRVRIAAVVGLGLVGALSIALAAAASTPGSSGTQPTVTVRAAVHHDLSRPLREMTPAVDPRKKFLKTEHEMPARVTTGALDPVIQSELGGGAMPAPTANFDGIGNGVAGFTVQYAPPDTNGDVGPNHYVQTVNVSFAVYNKSGALLYGPAPINTLWSGFGGGCQTNNDGDPTVVYDPIADRWIISQFSVSTTPYLQCVAVSQTPDPLGAYYRYSFSYGNVDFPDYPKMGVWPDGYYTTFNIFAGGAIFTGSKVCAFDRARMLQGLSATQQCFNTSNTYGGLLPADLDGSTLPPAGAPNYSVALGANTTTLAYWKFHVDWINPSGSTFTGPNTVAIASYSEACGGGTCIPQAGTTNTLDSLADRLMYRLAYRNYGDHEALVVNHSVTVGSSTGLRWYELRTSGTNLSLFQQGTFAPDASYRWMGSIAADRDGNLALGYSTSSSTLHPEIRYTGRLAGDPAGTMPQGETTLIAGAGSQTGSLHRWGDYSSMSVDPSDDCTFWFTTEYIPSNGSFNWRTRISGSYAALLGSSSAFNGDSTLTQTVTMPSGAPTLSFWYSPYCPDTVDADQIQMQIRKTSGQRLATVLNVCSNTGAWTQQIYNIPRKIAGRTVVLWFNVHDDGNASNPTYALFDDVAVNLDHASGGRRSGKRSRPSSGRGSH